VIQLWALWQIRSLTVATDCSLPSDPLNLPTSNNKQIYSKMNFLLQKQLSGSNLKAAFAKNSFLAMFFDSS
jgi:hypothetical protein